MATITTTYKTNSNGTGQILAKGGGRQRTVTYRPEHSRERNHGEAAGTLALVLMPDADQRRVAAEQARHTEDNNGRHVFSFGPMGF